MNNQSNKLLLSIAIPTYNRSDSLDKLLKNIIPQVQKLNGLVQICISNNGSLDNTHKLMIDFVEKYPGMIKYNENVKNLGVDKNLIKIMEMSSGYFIWLIGDDDNIVDNGIEKVISFINNHCNKNTGLVMLGHRSHFISHDTGKEVIDFDTVEKNKPDFYKIRLEDVVGIRLIHSFLSVLLFNNNFTKQILKDEGNIIEKAVGNHYIHTFVYNLMLLKYPKLETIRFNETIIDVDISYYKFYIEDKFELYYVARKRLNELLLSVKFVGDHYRRIIVKEKNKLFRGQIKEMASMKAFNIYNYFSFSGCIKLFFKRAMFVDALIFSIFFIIFYITPAFILRNAYKFFIIIKYRKKWENIWFHIVVVNKEMSKGTRRLIV